MCSVCMHAVCARARLPACACVCVRLTCSRAVVRVGVGRGPPGCSSGSSRSAGRGGWAGHGCVCRAGGGGAGQGCVCRAGQGGGVQGRGGEGRGGITVNPGL